MVDTRISSGRRGLARTMAAGLASFALAAAAWAGEPAKVTEKDVVVRTADGSAEAALFYPSAKGKWPAVLLWPDFVGLRPLYRDIARRFAAEGFVVLVPNSFYRSMRPSDAELDPWDPKVRPTLMKYRADATDDGIARDAAAYTAFLGAQKATDRRGKTCTVGYDLGASYAVRAAAALPDRIGAVGSVYGLGVAAARANSPHLLIPATRASYYIAMARDDDAREPEDKTDLANVIKAGKLNGVVEVYPADHGWANPAGKTYDAAAADRAFAALVKLCRAVRN